VTAPGPLVVLTGPPGAGKSAVGKLLSDRLHASFVDTDAEIEASAGKPVGDIFVDDGEDAFRNLERAVTGRALDADGAVVALGSGAVLDPAVQQRLAAQPVAYLSAGFPAIAKRLGLDRPRVIIPGNPRGRLRAMLEERQPVYERLATFTVDAGELAPEEIADEIQAWLAEGSSPS
jgi:shikimate kinase